MILRFRCCGCYAGALLMLVLLPGIASMATPARIYKAWYPLVGGPRFLRLHEAVIVEKADSTFTHYDFLPQDPTAIPTAIKLFTLQSLAGELRIRPLKRRPKDMVYIGTSAADAASMLAFVEAYDDKVSLLSNNCKTFADAFIAAHIADIAASTPIEGS